MAIGWTRQVPRQPDEIFVTKSVTLTVNDLNELLKFDLKPRSLHV